MTNNSEIFNAQIINTFLGIEDHGIMTFSINVKYNSFTQGFGGYSLDTYVKASDSREGLKFGISAIRKILEVMHVNCWEDLPKKYCRVKYEKGVLIAIGNIVDNEWFNIRDFAAQNQT